MSLSYLTDGALKKLKIAEKCINTITDARKESMPAKNVEIEDKLLQLIITS